jgi:hypothetical protein
MSERKKMTSRDILRDRNETCRRVQRGGRWAPQPSATAASRHGFPGNPTVFHAQLARLGQHAAESSQGSVAQVWRQWSARGKGEVVQGAPHREASLVLICIGGVSPIQRLGPNICLGARAMAAAVCEAGASSFPTRRLVVVRRHVRDSLCASMNLWCPHPFRS